MQQVENGALNTGIGQKITTYYDENTNAHHEILLDDEMEKKLKILEAEGFNPNSWTVAATLLNLHPMDSPDKYRTKMFQTEELRLNSHKQKIQRNRSKSDKSTDRLKNWDGKELYERCYVKPEPMIPYPYKHKNVTPEGFIRDQPNLAQKVLKTYKKWHENRKEWCATSVDENMSAQYDDMSIHTPSPTRFKTKHQIGFMENTGSSGYDHIGRTIGTNKNQLSHLSRGQLTKLDAIAEDAGPIKPIPCTYEDMQLAKRSNLMAHNQPLGLGLQKQQTSVEKTKNTFLQQNLSGSLYDRKRVGTMRKAKNRGKSLGLGLTEIEDIQSNTQSKNSPRNAGGFRLTGHATNYDFAHRPFEDKHIRQKKERDYEKNVMYGVVGNPARSQDRHLNKLFDHHRNKQKDVGGCTGCDIEYIMREEVFRVGQWAEKGATRGGLKTQNEETHQNTYRIMNIDRSTQREQTIAQNINLKTKYDSAFDGDNHFREIAKKRRRAQNMSALMNYENMPDGHIQDLNLSKKSSLVKAKRLYYPHVTQAQTGKFQSIMESQVTGYVPPGSVLCSRLTNYSINPSNRDTLNSKYKYEDNSILQQSRNNEQQDSFMKPDPNNPREKSMEQNIKNVRLIPNKFLTQSEQPMVEGLEDPNTATSIPKQKQKSPTSQVSDQTFLNRDEQYGDQYDGDMESSFLAAVGENEQEFNQATLSQKVNYSKIQHGKYFIDTNYGSENPNFHNRKEIYPQTFPLRPGTNFIEHNKTYEEVHQLDKLLNSEVKEKVEQQQYMNLVAPDMYKKPIGGYVKTNDGIIQRHQDPDPNRTLLLQHLGMLPDKHTAKSLRLTQSVLGDVVEYQNALKSAKKHPIPVPREAALASSTLISKLNEKRGKIVVKNGQPYLIATDPHKPQASGAKTKKSASALRVYQNFLSDKMEQQKKSYNHTGAPKRASSIMAGSHKASEILIKERTAGGHSGSMTPNNQMMFSEPASGYFSKPLSRDGAYTIRARVKSQMGGYQNLSIPIALKNGFKTQQNWNTKVSDTNYASIGGGQTIYSGISEQSTHANMAKGKHEKNIKTSEIQAMFQMF